MPPSKRPTSNGWNEYQKLVLFRLNEQHTKMIELETKIDNVHTAVTLLKYKVATISSGVGAAFGAAVAYWVR